MVTFADRPTHRHNLLRCHHPRRDGKSLFDWAPIFGLLPVPAQRPQHRGIRYRGKWRIEHDYVLTSGSGKVHWRGSEDGDKRPGKVGLVGVGVVLSDGPESSEMFLFFKRERLGSLKSPEWERFQQVGYSLHENARRRCQWNTVRLCVDSAFESSDSICGPFLIFVVLAIGLLVVFLFLNVVRIFRVSRLFIIFSLAPLQIAENSLCGFFASGYCTRVHPV